MTKTPAWKKNRRAAAWAPRPTLFVGPATSEPPTVDSLRTMRPLTGIAAHHIYSVTPDQAAAFRKGPTS